MFNNIQKLVQKLVHNILCVISSIYLLLLSKYPERLTLTSHKKKKCCNPNIHRMLQSCQFESLPRCNQTAIALSWNWKEVISLIQSRIVCFDLYERDCRLLTCLCDMDRGGKATGIDSYGLHAANVKAPNNLTWINLYLIQGVGGEKRRDQYENAERLC